MQHIYNKYPDCNVYLSGFSLGASIAGKYLGKYGDQSRIKGVAMTSNPFDVYKAAVSANSWYNFIYGWFMT